jgi:uncharacterized protein (DUF1330 family)
MRDDTSSAPGRPFEILVGVEVRDEKGYADYRAAMTPLLEARGGRFGVDVEVAKVLKTPGSVAFNRLFTIRFPSAREQEEFFADPDYVAIKKRLFEPSVGGAEVLGRYSVAAP